MRLISLIALSPLLGLYTALGSIEQKARIEAVIDWQREKIILTAEWKPGMRIATYSNAELRQHIRDALLEKLSILVETLYRRAQRSDETLPSLDLSALWSSLSLNSFQVAENKAYATMELRLLGNESLLAFLPLHFGSEIQTMSDEKKSTDVVYDRRPAVGQYDNAQTEPLLYTGLIVDARHLPYVPSLNAGIYTSNGRQIYGAEFLTRNTTVKRGTSGFDESDTSPAVLRRVGKRPLKVSALDLMPGEGNSLVISEEDAAKLLAHTGSVRNLSRARVVILITRDRLREKF